MKFAKHYAEYGQNLDILQTWIDTSVEAIQRVSGMDKDKAEEFVLSQPELDNINDTKIKFLLQDKDGNRAPKMVPIKQYLDRMGKHTGVMTPMFTSFLSKDVKEAPQPKYIKEKMAERKKVKKASIVAKNKKDFVKATILTGVQNAIKILINSFSGAALSAHNPFYSGSLHQVLCAMCRVSTAIATSLIERLIAGIRYYHKPSLVSDDLMQTIMKCNTTEVAMAMEEFGLHYPTRDECLDVIRRSYLDYWWDTEKEDEFLPILDQMTKEERAAFVYTLDFYHLFKFNDGPIREFVKDLTFNDFMSLPTDVPWVMDSLSDDETNFLAGIIGEDIKGSFLYEAIAEDSEIRLNVNALAHRLKAKLTKYTLLGDAFFLTDILPLDVGNQDKAIRYATSLGDTDSSLYTTMMINEIYYGEADFTTEQDPVTELCIFLANGVIEHGLGVFTGQMNVHPDDRYRLALKNEFRFNSLQMTPYKKTYFASIAACEGAVYADDNRQYEIKGQRFHAGKSNRDMIKELHNWMKEIPWKLKAGEKIDRGELLRMIEDIENDIESSLDRRTDVKFSTLKIKPYEAYSNPKSQEWAKHKLWNWCFGDTHEEGTDEGYTAYKLPLRFEGGLEHFLKTTTPEVRAGFEKYLNYVTDNKKDKWFSKSITYIPIPIDSMINHGIPDEIKPLVDIEKAIKRALDPHLLMLANLGIVTFKKDKSSGDNVVIQKRISDILV